GRTAGLVMAQAVAGWRDSGPVQARATLSVNGEVVREGTGGAVLGHPLDALARYVVERIEGGRPIAAGEIVSTGTWTAPHRGQAGEQIVADFGPLGRVEVELG